MRILFVSPSVSNPNGGASRVYHLLTDGFRARGHAVKCLHLEDIPIPHRFRFAAHRLALPHFASKAAKQALIIPYDVVMCPSGMLYPLYRSMKRSRNRPLLVQEFHGLSIFDHQAIVTEELRGHTRSSLVYRTLTSRIPTYWDFQGFRYADMAVVLCDRDKDLLTERSSVPVHTIPLALHPQIAEAGRVSDDCERDPLGLVWFGSWSVRKGCHYLPAAFSIIAEAYPGVTLSIGGTGLGDALKEKFDPAIRGRITVLPRISVEEQISLFKRNSIFLFPSISEGFGFSLLEAMGMGMASIATATGFGADLPPEQEVAVLIPPASALHLARATMLLLGNGELRARIAGNGQQFARKLTLETMTSSYERAFEAGVKIHAAQAV